MCIAEVLVDTSIAFSMLKTAMYQNLPNAPAIQLFTGAAPNVISVGGANSKFRVYVDAFVELDETIVCYLLLVVKQLTFKLLIGNDILYLHDAMFALTKIVSHRV